MQGAGHPAAVCCVAPSTAVTAHCHTPLAALTPEVLADPPCRLSACAEDLGNCTAQAAALVEARRAGGEAEADLAARGMALEARADQLLERTTQLTQVGGWVGVGVGEGRGHLFSFYATTSGCFT
jgi:hypothetical protein